MIIRIRLTVVYIVQPGRYNFYNQYCCINVYVYLLSSNKHNFSFTYCQHKAKEVVYAVILYIFLYVLRRVVGRCSVYYVVRLVNVLAFIVCLL